MTVATTDAASLGLHPCMRPALVFSNLTKTYRNGVQALKGVDLEVPEGEFFALLGPNGAGKTTAIGIVTSLVKDRKSVV